MGDIDYGKTTQEVYLEFCARTCLPVAIVTDYMVGVRSNWVEL
jgi:hypothetical protein